jgi:hypothetical protein
MLTQDKLWKAILEDFFPEAIEFYFAGLSQEIDWGRGFEVLDKELKQIFPESEETHRRVDFLAKVWLRDGSEYWILIHIEVQGYRDEGFARRMFIYFYRLTDRFNVPVASLAILTDHEPDWRPARYESAYFGTKLTFEYPVFKLADYLEKDFPDMRNPWAWVMKAALTGLKSNWDDDSLLKVKIQIYRDFRKNGYSKEKVRLFLQFLKYYVRFAKKEFFDNFDKQIQIVEHIKDQQMGIIELVKQHLIEEAKEEGLEKGMTEGEKRKARRVVERIAEKYPDWTDEEIAGLVEMPVDFVAKARTAFLKKKKK